MVVVFINIYGMVQGGCIHVVTYIIVYTLLVNGCDQLIESLCHVWLVENIKEKKKQKDFFFYGKSEKG